MEGATNTMSTLLESGTTVLTWVITSIGSILELIMGEPLLLVGTILMLIGVCFGFIRRSISTF